MTLAALTGSVRQEREHMFVPKYTEEEAREAVASSLCYSEALRKLGLRPHGGNFRLFRKYVDEIWHLPTGHFNPDAARVARVNTLQRPIPIADVLVEGSSYSRTKLKQRLYDTGLKTRNCELCGQGENWKGRRMSLILDHINGVPDDNRLANLQIVCPNCAATLDTHCGRQNRMPPRNCALCGQTFIPRYARQRYCSSYCGERHGNRNRAPKPETRKVPRPPYEQLIADLQTMSFCAVGRKYGVSDNAIRKWLHWERDARARTEALRTQDPPPDTIAA